MFPSVHFQAKDVISIHAATCPSFENEEKKIQFSSDGVSETKSTSVSLDVYSMKFVNCKNVYPLRIIKPIKKINIDQSLHFNQTLRDLYANHCCICQFIGDNPKRAQARQSLSHASWYPCEYCGCKGTKIVTNDVEIEKKKNLEIQKKIVNDKIEELKNNSASNNEIDALKNIEKELIESEKKLKTKKSNIVWPKTSANGPPRTREEYFEIIQHIENNQPLTQDEAKGVVGRSALFDIPNFDFINGIAVDYMHCVCIGVVKRCVELTFRVGEVRSRITNRPLSPPALFNSLIHGVKVPRESNRRVRDLDFAVYKAQEYRNLLLFFFPLVINCIEEGEKERDMWLYLSYMIKACVLPSEEYARIEENIIKYCCEQFYSLYEDLFGVRNCTYNTHTMASHVQKMRCNGPLTLTSAFAFESFYGEMRQAFVPGTTSTLKQILSNVLMKRFISPHKCVQTIFYSEKDTAMECNSLIYTFSENQYKFYKICAIDEHLFQCQEIKQLPCTFMETPTLDWSLVGVFMKGETSPEKLNIHKSSIKGKIILINNYMITYPNNVLREK